MRRRKRFTIKLFALGLAVAGIAAMPAQARLDEGLNGLQPLYIETETLVTADDIGRPTPGQVHYSPVGVESSGKVIAPDDISGRVSPVPSQPTIVSSDDGFQLGTLGMSSMVLLLGVGAMFWTVYFVRHRRHAIA